jgi:hypothetical protein
MSMNASPHQPTAGQKAAGVIAGLSIVFCSMEMVPGWGMFNLDWPPAVFYGIMAVCGALAGVIGAAEHRLPGLVGGLIAGPSSLFAVGYVLAHVTVTHNIVLVLVAMIGALPGLAVFKVLAAIQDAIMPVKSTLSSPDATHSQFVSANSPTFGDPNNQSK